MLVAAVVLRCLLVLGIILGSPSGRHLYAMGLGTWGACGLGFENSYVLLGNLSIACCGINGGLGLKSRSNARQCP
ncbi:hypothetical protein FNV43_RR20975 [Rhamnella rubrinervis]|uniref:Secreted protein n=1 Tax=Rhamnella rubrinervis TaxID=2594499 RepID=A0A8K0E268_9ROSA|nr:hypothetical protein FNV43_RR20975 [Rhamnella rubrinervis]